MQQHEVSSMQFPNKHNIISIPFALLIYTNENQLRLQGTKIMQSVTLEIWKCNLRTTKLQRKEI